MNQKLEMELQKELEELENKIYEASAGGGAVVAKVIPGSKTDTGHQY